MRRTGIQMVTVLAIGCGGGGAGDTGEAASSGAAASTAAATSTGGSTGEVAPTTGGDASTGGSTGGEVPACGDGMPADPPIEWDPGQPDIAGCSVRGLREYRTCSP